MQIKLGILKNDNLCAWLNLYFVVTTYWILHLYIYIYIYKVQTENFGKKPQRPNWPKLQAQKPKLTEKPTKTKTNQNQWFFNYFNQFRLRLLQIENFSFSWSDKKNRPNRTDYNPTLHGSVILLLRDVTSNSRVTFTSMCGVHATFLISLAFEVKEIVLSLGTHGFLLMGTWSYHSWLLHSLLHEFFPQTVPIVGTHFEALTQYVKGYRPSEPSTINL